MNSNWTKRIGWVFATVVSSGFCSGCESDGDRFCADTCDCVTCPGSTLDRCETQFDALVDISDEFGCSNQTDAFIACLAETSECKDGQVVFDCRNEQAAAEECLQADIRIGGGQ